MKSKSRFLLVLLVGALLLRLFKLGSQSFWVDEILTFAKSSPKEGLGIWDYLKYNIQGPAHAFVVWVFQLVGRSEWWLRLPSAVAGTVSVYYLYRWFDEWLGRPIARTAAVLGTVHPLHIYYSQELRNYAFLFAFMVFASYHLHVFLRERRLRRLPRYVIGLALAALSNFSAAFLYAVHTLIYVPGKGLRRRVAVWLVVSIAVLVLIAPWVYRVVVVIDVPKLFTPVKPGAIPTTQLLRGETTAPIEAVPYAFYTFAVGYTLGPSLRDLHASPMLASVWRHHWPVISWVALLFGALSAIGVASIARDPRRGIEVLLYILVPIVLVFLLSWQNAKAFNIRYVLLSFIIFLGVVAAGIEALPGLWRRVAIVAVLATLFVSLANYYFNNRYAKEDVRGAASVLEARAKPGECILAPTIAAVFDHYYRGAGDLQNFFAPLWMPADKVDAQLDTITGNCPTIWYVKARSWAHDPYGRIEQRFATEYALASSQELPGVEVREYRRRENRTR